MASDQIEQAKLGNLIRKCRQKRRLTLKELCDKAGVSVGYLSQVERGNATPSLGTLAQIARALDLGLDYFVTRPKPGDAVSYADQRRKFSISDTGVTYEALSTEFPGHELSAFIMNCPPGFQSETFQHEGEEFIYILSGSIEKSLDGETFTLREGDSLHYNGMTPHAWKTLGDTPARMLWTGSLVVLQGAQNGRLPGQRS
ncbi:XRE family transcriptional regulator [Shimia thalassica]|uniref:HTH-type transcriptional regulator PuuR n=1 Tax=Shimia thalassica TaxID=1715693 RepID=A0A0P1IFZ5_9RHOB|nr:XRE family transcriptional regulator [Shimia thalassica]PHO02117.1 XRE family transcriptional regulator [Rhodobacteraceae bacterium 4F10]MBU2943170.1 XRE family transcriptional regulator [Shimia thalassica]MDO6481745.1 XRE family transcriptional regulator [Shimia thalassica]MDO6486011.1 XRE family transcriptional regulator [Shimia thalassica]MDO6505185.1 XRE family transcriptional regulator [Shimia thalassica]